MKRQRQMQKFVGYQNQAQRKTIEKEWSSKLVKVNLAKPQCHTMLNKIICKQKKLKFKGKRQKLLVQINNFQFDKGRSNKN